MLTAKPDVLCAAEKAMMMERIVVVCLLFIIVVCASSNCRVFIACIVERFTLALLLFKFYEDCGEFCVLNGQIEHDKARSDVFGAW